MHKFLLAQVMTLSASVLMISACALPDTAQPDKIQDTIKDCIEQAKGSGVGIGIAFGPFFGVGIGHGNSDEGKASTKDCRSAKPAKSAKTAQQNN